MSEHFLRQLTMLQLVPRSTQKISTRKLCEKLEQEGFEVTQRTVQRDLKRFSKLFPDLMSDGNLDQAGWSWKRDASVKDLPGMNTPLAMTFMLAQRFLDKLMPPAVLEQLGPYFASANQFLDKLEKHEFSAWDDKVRIVPRSQPLIPATISQEVMDVIYQALLEGHQFRGRYRRRDRDEAEYDFHPLGLVFRESVVYLVATVWDYHDPRHYALHRFQKCTLLEDKTATPADFDLDGYLSTGAFEYVDHGAEEILLVARFTKDVARHLEETPLSQDQKTMVDTVGWVRVKATVKDSHQLRWWLLGFGARVEVIEPLHLRKEFQKMTESLCGYYS